MTGFIRYNEYHYDLYRKSTEEVRFLDDGKTTIRTDFNPSWLLGKKSPLSLVLLRMVWTHLSLFFTHSSISLLYIHIYILLNVTSIPILFYIFIHTYNYRRFHRWIYHWTWCPLSPPYAGISPPVTSWRRGRGMLLASRLLLLWVNYWSCVHLDLAPCLLSLCECHLYPSFFFWTYCPYATH